jgi:hypothetical protein
MKLVNWQYCEEPSSKHSCLLYFDDNYGNCAFYFDAPRPIDGEDYPNPVRSVSPLICALGRKRDNATPIAKLSVWMGLELLRRYVNGTPIPPDGESGIERHFRELEEAA